MGVIVEQKRTKLSNSEMEKYSSKLRQHRFLLSKPEILKEFTTGHILNPKQKQDISIVWNRNKVHYMQSYQDEFVLCHSPLWFLDVSSVVLQGGLNQATELS